MRSCILTLAALLAVLTISASAAAIDGVIEINAAAVAAGGITPGDAPGYPATLARSGSYKLTGDLATFSRGTTFVQITAPRVTLDLNGFTVGACLAGGLCASGNATAISGPTAAQVVIRNGNVAGAGGECLDLGVRATVERLHVTGCGADGIRVRESARIASVVVAGAGFYGVSLGRFGSVRDSTIIDNARQGLAVSGSVLVLDTVIRGNIGAIILTGTFQGEGGGYRGCLIIGNDGTAEAQPISAIFRSLGGNLCGTDTVCP